jgi:hypothetical protein
MADFVAVLKKALDGLSEATPPLRQKVYDKARATIEAKLAAINPPPPQAVADRQRKSLEDAIASLEKEYADKERPKASDPLQELEDVFASIERQKSAPPKPVAPAPRSEPVAKPAPAPAPAPASKSDFASWLDTAPKTMPTAPASAPAKPEAAAYKPATPAAAPAPKPVAQPQADDKPKTDLAAEMDDWNPAPVARKPQPAIEPVKDDFFDAANDHDDDEDGAAPQEVHEPRQGKRSYGGLIAAAIALVVVAGGGYGVWASKGALANLFSGSGKHAEAPAASDAAPETKTAAAPATPEHAQQTAPSTPAGEPKLTQRLNTDGTEVDPGPASGGASIGEGTSVAAATQPPVTQTGAAASGQTPPAQKGSPAGQPAVAVGQRAIFYEERTNVAQGSAEPGSIVWSVVKESPGGDLPPEPAIRAEAVIPGKDLQLRMTIRRNADQTLPASHIVEVIFLTPQGFEGGGIENVLRVSMKGSEQEAGNPLIGIPAKIADGFFLIALNDGKPEMEANLSLLRSQSWIDVPIIYKSGRRALFTMEKGIPGQKVFDEAIKAWQAAGNGNG